MSVISHGLRTSRRPSLAETIATQLREYIIQSRFAPGQRLPTTAELAARFQVGAPTIREALRKLETMGIVVIKHGSGIFVGDRPESLLFADPLAPPTAPTKGLLLDLIEARRPIEVLCAGLAATNITDEQLASLEALLEEAKQNLQNDEVLNRVNMQFHRGIAAASGNTVIPEVLSVLTSLFKNEQRLIMNIFGSRQKDHSEHMAIFDALRRHDVQLATHRMDAHLEGVRRAIEQWVPDEGTAEES